MYLLEGLKNLLSLAEVSKEQVKSPGHQGRVVVHSEVEQDP